MQDENSTGHNGCTAVFSNLSNEPPRLFVTESSRCDCAARLANDEDMCPHEILAKGGFQESLFKPRHFARTRVSGSIIGWTDTSNTGEGNSLDAMIGYEAENISPAQGDLSVGYLDDGMLVEETDEVMDVMFGKVDMTHTDTSLLPFSARETSRPGQLLYRRRV